MAENLVQLTDAQVKNAGITTTRAEKRNIATALKVSGRIDVPPQNIVSVSFPLGGYLKSTNLLPGMHHSAFVEAQFTERARAKGTTYEQEVAEFSREWRIAADRFGDCDDVGAFVAMFCSEFANYITGQSLVIDGGATTSTF